MSKQNKRTNRNRQPNNQPRNRQQRLRDGYAIFRSPRPIMPNQYDTVLKLTVIKHVGPGGGSLECIRFSSNAFEPDPSTPSEVLGGFPNFATFYARFRTIAIHYKFNVANEESFPVSYIHGFSNSVIASNALTIDYGENPLMRTGILGSVSGQGRSILTQTSSVTNIAGTAQALYDDLYTGSTTSNSMPAPGQVHAYFGVETDSAHTFTNGVLVHVQFDLHVRFFRPLFINQ